MSDDRDLAEAIYTALTSDKAIDAALDLWSEIADLPDRDVLETVISANASDALGRVLARRQREAARTGPWDGGHHFQEEDGYPGSLLPPKRELP